MALAGKVLCNIDLVDMARAAEEAGVDFRVVALTRSLGASVVSAVRRKYGQYRYSSSARFSPTKSADPVDSTNQKSAPFGVCCGHSANQKSAPFHRFRYGVGVSGGGRLSEASVPVSQICRMRYQQMLQW